MCSVYPPKPVVKDDFKFNKIFRPWDNTCFKDASEDTAQDSTISTTSELGDSTNSEPMKVDCDEKTPSVPPSPKKGFRKPKPKVRQENAFNHLDVLGTYPLEPYTTFPDMVPTNIAHSLGLPPNDPLLLETLAQGCAYEEYARVLNQEQQAKILNIKKQRPKKYKCPHCEVGFSNNGQLKGHIRIHTGERPFKCDQKDCGKTFTRNEELTRHKRIHSGLRPYPCTHCGKRFGRKDHLKKHSRTHFQPRGVYAVPVMLPFETWATTPSYPFIPMYGY